MKLKFFAALTLLLAAVPAWADAPARSLQQQVEAVLATAPQGTRFGLLVVDADGREVVAIAPDQRFIPASNTKLFTTAAALADYPGMDRPDVAGGTDVALVPVRQPTMRGGGVMVVGASATGPLPSGPLDVWLMGNGDARMSSAADCTSDCLAALADAVAARTRRVRDVVGDDSIWPDQRWSPGMSWNNIASNDGTAASALNLDSNELTVLVRPAAAGQAPAVTAPAYYSFRNEATTGAPGSPNTLALDRAVGGMDLRLYGSIPADAAEWRDRIGIDDPAHYAAWTLRRMLEARGVRVAGTVRAYHRPVADWDAPGASLPLGPPIMLRPPALAALIPPPLVEDIAIINKSSQNLHAEVLARRLGDLHGTGSRAWAGTEISAVLERAGIARAGYDFSDGSGMSTYNRVSPRAAVALLRWGQSQPWGAAWRASFPIGGTDGTLRRRFAQTPLQGGIFAKTGTLNATNALSGYLTAASGRELTFSIFANDVPDGANAVPVIDAALQVIAAAM